MKVWLSNFKANKYENLQWKKFNLELSQSFDGKCKMEDWKPIEVKRLYDREYSNSPSLAAHIPVFDKCTVEALGKVLGNAEILPLVCKDGEFFAINIIDILDCIKYEESEYKTFSDGEIYRFTKYVFNKDKIEDKFLFKITDEPLSYPFVTDEFKRVVEESGLTGFQFEEVWSSEREKY